MCDGVAAYRTSLCQSPAIRSRMGEIHSKNTGKDRIDKSDFRRVFDLLNILTNLLSGRVVNLKALATTLRQTNPPFRKRTERITGCSADTNSRISSSTTRTADAHRTGKPSIQRQSTHNGADHRGRYAPLYRLAGHQTTACPSSLLDFCSVPRTLTVVQP